VGLCGNQAGISLRLPFGCKIQVLSWQSVAACIEAGFDFIIANKGCEPPFDPNNWYRPWKRKNIEYNSCV
jgi:hypothetical protein